MARGFQGWSTTEFNHNSILCDSDYRYITTILTDPDLGIKGYDDLLLCLLCDTLTVVLGFKNGVLPLRRDFGIDRIGDLIACTPQQILQVPGIGKRKLEKLQESLSLLGLALDAPCPTWKPLPVPHTKFATRGLQ